MPAGCSSPLSMIRFAIACPWSLRIGASSRSRTLPARCGSTGLPRRPLSTGRRGRRRPSVLYGGRIARAGDQPGCAGGADGKPVVMILPTWSGPPEEGEARVAPLLKLGTLFAGAVEAMSYGASLTLCDPYLANGQPVFMETCWLPAFDRGAIDVFIQAMETAVSPGCAIFTHEFKGAASR